MAKYIYQTLTGAGSSEIRTVASATDDFSFEIDVLYVAQTNPTPQDWHCPLIRFCRPADGSSGGYTLQMMRNGVQLMLASGTILQEQWGSASYGTPIGGPAVTWTINRVGSNISVLRNGVEVLNVSDSTYIGGYSVLRVLDCSAQWSEVNSALAPTDLDTYANGAWTSPNVYGDWQVLFAASAGIDGTADAITLTADPNTQANSSPGAALTQDQELTGAPATQANSSPGGAIVLAISLTADPSTQGNESPGAAITRSQDLTADASVQVNESPGGSIAPPTPVTAGSNFGYGQGGSGGGGGTARRIKFSAEVEEKYGEDDPLEGIMREILDPPAPEEVATLLDAEAAAAAKPAIDLASVRRTLETLQRQRMMQERQDEEDLLRLFTY